MSTLVSRGGIPYSIRPFDSGLQDRYPFSSMENMNTMLAGKLQSLRDELQSSFKMEQWNGMSGALTQLAALGETQGHLELSLRAQSLKELMGNRAGGRQSAGARIEELFNDLLFHISHLQWINQTSQ